MSGHPLFGRARGERGFALSSPLALLSAAAVVLAGATFVVTKQPAPPAQASQPARSVAPSAQPVPTTTAPSPVVRAKKKKPAVKRGETYVEVYNNSGISGLAGSVADRAQGAGWQVVGSDNWYGTIEASTVYYPARLKAAAELLGRDLGVKRVRPTIAPMRGDRLTVILTADYR